MKLMFSEGVAPKGRGKLAGGVSHRLGRIAFLAPTGAPLIDLAQRDFRS